MEKFTPQMNFLDEYEELEIIHHNHHKITALVQNKISALKYVVKSEKIPYLQKHIQIPTSQKQVSIRIENAKQYLKLRHQNLVKLEFITVQNNFQHIITEYAGENIENLLFAGKFFDEDEILKLISQIAQALLYLHSTNLFHNHLTTNFIHYQEGHVKIRIPYYYIYDTLQFGSFSTSTEDNDILALGKILFELLNRKKFENDEITLQNPSTCQKLMILLTNFYQQFDIADVIDLISDSRKIDLKFAKLQKKQLAQTLPYSPNVQLDLTLSNDSIKLKMAQTTTLKEIIHTQKIPPTNETWDEMPNLDTQQPLQIPIQKGPQKIHLIQRVKKNKKEETSMKEITQSEGADGNFTLK